MQTAISCVIDDDPRFLTQARLLLASLRSAGVRQDDASTVLVVHVPQAMADARELEPLRQLGALIQPYEAFATGAGAYCNKLVQLRTAALRQADRVLLLDADMLILRDPRPLFDPGAVRGKIVDFPLPPAEKWQRLFREAGFAEVETAATDFAPGTETPARNCNGGAYYLPRAAFAALAEAWPRWSRHCLAQEALLGEHLHHSDQLGFALAMQELGLPFRPLSLGDNFPTHLQVSGYAHVPRQQITAAHYHRHVDGFGLPSPVGIDWIDQQVTDALHRIRRNHDVGPDNAACPERRHATDPAAGPGPGPRGAAMLDKRRQLAPILDAYSDSLIVEIGCGDLELLRVFDLDDYTGYELSTSGLDLARARRPDWRFRHGSSHDAPRGAAALSICLDVAIHQTSPDEYRKLVHDVIEISHDAVLISGYEGPPDAHGATCFHQPLSQTLAAHPDIACVTQIGGWRDVTLFLAERKRADRNPHDITAARLCGALASSPHPALLKSLVALGRDKLGFFPQTIIRCIEYPWIAARMPRPLDGLRVLDMGAGVSPLPLWLARQGARVTTVDGHDKIRAAPAQPDWNEWGYLDYGQLDRQIRSHHCMMQDLRGAGPFDLIYSVSVIEHIPAEARRAVLAAMKDNLAPGGRLLLTLDLIPGTDQLWNLSEGLRVDEGAAHGSIADFMTELATLGFDVTEKTEFRSIEDSRTELLMVDARL